LKFTKLADNLVESPVGLARMSDDLFEWFEDFLKSFENLSKNSGDLTELLGDPANSCSDQRGDVPELVRLYSQ
jgi:hypothetical protein